MENKQEKRRSFILDVEDAKNELIKAFNDIIKKYNMPCYFLEPTLQKLTSEAHNIALQELAAARQGDNS